MPPQEISECYLGLGSNLGDPVANIDFACEKLSKLAALDLVKVSPLYQSSAMTLITDGTDGTDEVQPNYVNATVKCLVSCPPPQLLSIAKSIEQEMGRIADEVKWGARIIDIDILFIKGFALQTPDLKIPHPGLTLRPFVLYPLRDIEPELQLTTEKTVSDYADGVQDDWNTTLLKDSTIGNSV